MAGGTLATISARQKLPAASHTAPALGTSLLAKQEYPPGNDGKSDAQRSAVVELTRASEISEALFYWGNTRG